MGNPLDPEQGGVSIFDSTAWKDKAECQADWEQFKKDFPLLIAKVEADFSGLYAQLQADVKLAISKGSPIWDIIVAFIEKIITKI